MKFMLIGSMGGQNFFPCCIDKGVIFCTEQTRLIYTLFIRHLGRLMHVNSIVDGHNLYLGLTDVVGDVYSRFPVN